MEPINIKAIDAFDFLFKKDDSHLIDNIRNNENIELIAFEDALEDLIDDSQNDNPKNTKNFVNDA